MSRSRSRTRLMRRAGAQTAGESRALGGTEDGDHRLRQVLDALAGGDGNRQKGAGVERIGAEGFEHASHPRALVGTTLGAQVRGDLLLLRGRQAKAVVVASCARVLAEPCLDRVHQRTALGRRQDGVKAIERVALDAERDERGALLRVQRGRERSWIDARLLDLLGERLEDRSVGLAHREPRRATLREELLDARALVRRERVEREGLAEQARVTSVTMGVLGMGRVALVRERRAGRHEREGPDEPGQAKGSDGVVESGIHGFVISAQIYGPRGPILPPGRVKLFARLPRPEYRSAAMPRAARHKVPQPDVDALVAAATAALEQDKAVARSRLGPSSVRERVLEALGGRGYEVTAKTVRVPVHVQLETALGDGSYIATSALGAHVNGASKKEVVSAAVALVAKGGACLVMRNKSETLVPRTAEVVAGKDLAIATARASELAMHLRGAVKKGKGIGVLRADVREALDAILPERPRNASRGNEPGSVVRLVLRAVDRARDGSAGLSFVPKVVALLAPDLDGDAAKAALLEAASRGLLELRPEGGLGRLSESERRACPEGPQGTRLSWARRLEVQP